MIPPTQFYSMCSVLSIYLELLYRETTWNEYSVNGGGRGKFLMLEKWKKYTAKYIAKYIIHIPYASKIPIQKLKFMDESGKLMLHSLLITVTLLHCSQSRQCHFKACSIKIH